MSQNATSPQVAIVPQPEAALDPFARYRTASREMIVAVDHALAALGDWDTPLVGDTPEAKVEDAASRIIAVSSGVAGVQQNALYRAAYAMWQASKEGTIIGKAGKFPNAQAWLQKVNESLPIGARFFTYSSVVGYANRMDKNLAWMKAYGPTVVDAWIDARKLLSEPEMATFVDLCEKGGTYEGQQFPALAQGEAAKARDVLNALVAKDAIDRGPVDPSPKSKPRVTKSGKAEVDAPPPIIEPPATIANYKVDSGKLGGANADTNSQEKALAVYKDGCREYVSLYLRLVDVSLKLAEIKAAIPGTLQDAFTGAARDIVKDGEMYRGVQRAEKLIRDRDEERHAQQIKDQVKLADIHAPLPDANQGAEEKVKANLAAQELIKNGKAEAIKK